MNPGLPFKKKITTRGSLNNGIKGIGSHFYITDTGANVCCVDKSLLTAANYVGAGVWTVNPVVASIPIALGYGGVVFIDRSNTIWVFTGTSSVQIIDANPESPTFNTIIATALLLDQNAFIGQVAYDNVHNIIYRRSGSAALGSMLRLAEDGLSGRGGSMFTSGGVGGLLGVTNPGFNKYCKQINSFIVTPTNGTGTVAVNVAQVIKTSMYQCVSSDPFSTANGMAWSCDKYLYNLSGGAVRIMDKDFKQVAAIGGVNAGLCAPGFSESQRVLVTGSNTTNSFSFISRDTLLNLGNLAKGFVAPGETGTNHIVVSDDVAVAAGNGSFSTLHAINVSNRSYIGYVNLPISYGPHPGCYMAKNRIEI